MIEKHEENLEQAQTVWNASLRQTAEQVGNLLGGTGDLLSRHCELVLLRGERSYNPVPELIDQEGGVLLECNLDAYDIWIDTLGEIPGLGRQDIQQLYLGIGVAWVELAYLAKSAQHDRDLGMSGTARTRAQKRAVAVFKKLLSREDLFDHADTIEKETQLVGVRETVEKLSEEQVMRVNQIRYGIGVSLHILNTTEEVKRNIPRAFSANLHAELLQRESTLLEFIYAFSKADRYADIARDYAKIKKHSFPEFLFAGTMPMDITDAL